MLDMTQLKKKIYKKYTKQEKESESYKQMILEEGKQRA